MGTISFQNSGLIDMRAVTTFGVSAKEGENPIGFFGTGLKYAIAVILRNGGRVTIWRGEQEFNFSAAQEEIRGQEFGIVTMRWPGAAAAGHSEDECTKLGFTTHVGARWEAWMAFRELYCNALDEPDSEVASFALKPNPTKTTIQVSGWVAFEDAYADRNEIVLSNDLNPASESKGVEFYRKQSEFMHVKRVRAAALEKPSRFTMNLIRNVALTEDRTIKDQWSADYTVRNAILTHHDPDFLEEWLTSPEGSYEHHLNLNGYADPSDAFIEAALRLRHEHRRPVNPSMLSVLAKHRRLTDALTSESLTERNAGMVEYAVAMLARIGYPDPRKLYRVVYVHALGPQVFGMAYLKEETIVIAMPAFDRGARFLAGTLLEEYLHLSQGLDDESRPMQNYLLDKLMAVTEELMAGQTKVMLLDKELGNE